MIKSNGSGWCLCIKFCHSCILFACCVHALQLSSCPFFYLSIKPKPKLVFSFVCLLLAGDKTAMANVALVNAILG
ncbi:MAG: hypothetical protein JWQ25_846 [Daejeonella sp.]|nr:hypothetical protein [Daejeonella sp.]